ncbi:DUF5024 domain-containing protein [uncultured Parabacteroides sp.]|jgi:hypothetical protein|uniref:DUF5024 domain-containing protein n=2 Tax=Parabacteroides TaxID=375288 RepID=UPI0025DE7B19|nr:DUF5024 domain-containing protein [uncultured Parabacteroides sp.]
MKTRNLILTVTLLMAGSWASNLMAQTNLNALMKKCESMEKVNVDVIYDKDRKTKKPVKEVITVTFSRKDNPKLLDEFLDAFRKDKEAAYKVMESKIDGKVMPSFYRFAVGTSDLSFSLEDLNKKFKGNEYMLRNGEIRVTKIERFDFKEESEWG